MINYHYRRTWSIPFTELTQEDKMIDIHCNRNVPRQDQVCLTFLFTYCQINALRAHHASAHGGVLANGLSDICLIFLRILLSYLK